MADASRRSDAGRVAVTLAAAAAVGEVRQLADGRAAVLRGGVAGASGDRVNYETSGQFAVTKVTGVVLLAGGEVWWDHSANNATYRRTNDRDFYLGTATADAASGDTTVTVDLGAEPRWAVDLLRDAYVTVPTGTQALGGFLPPQPIGGGAIKLLLSSTNEAQKVDALSKDSFANGANGIVELVFAVVSDGAGSAPDFSIGIAGDTHATDADAIAQHLLVHLDGNATAINLQSKDGTTTVTATDSLQDYTEGATNRVHVWFDMRDPADVQVYVNGANVLPATVFNVNAAASEWKLLAHLEKTAAADTYEVDVERLRVRTAEQ